MNGQERATKDSPLPDHRYIAQTEIVVSADVNQMNLYCFYIWLTGGSSLNNLRAITI